MNVWTFHMGELLRIDPSPRLFRYGLLAEVILSKGHSVVQWAPTFNHFAKEHRKIASGLIDVQKGHQVFLVDAGRYKKNISFARWLFNARFARRFRTLAGGISRPDIIICSVPSVEMCCAALDFAEPFGIPVILDIRDCWPDLIIERSPPIVRPIARVALRSMERQLRRSVERAAAIIGVGDGMIDWALSKAGRARTIREKVFRTAYPTARLDTDVSKSEEYWRNHGVEIFGNKNIVAIVGSLNENLGYDLLAKEISAIPTDLRSEVQFVICGEGPMRKIYSDLQTTLGNSVISAPGWTQAGDLSALLNCAIAAVHPYPDRFDLLMCAPNKVGEYLSYGLPVLACTDGEVRRLLEHYRFGLIYDGSRPGSLLGCISRLISEPGLRNKLSHNARRAFEYEFDAERVYGELANYLEQLFSELQLTECVRTPYAAFGRSSASVTNVH